MTQDKMREALEAIRYVCRNVGFKANGIKTIDDLAVFALSAERQSAERGEGKWEIDHSTASPILVYDKCSVIQDEQALYVMRLIQQDTAPAEAVRGPCIPVTYCALATSTHVPVGSDEDHCDLCGHPAQPAALATPAEAGSGDGWRPIETAPVNKAILIHLPNTDYYGNDGVYAGMLVDMGTGKRWMTFGWAAGRDVGPDNEPDGWQPLPAAPNPEGKGDRA